jgi:hypothetical protein
VTLRDAANYIMKLPKAEQNLEAWQTAVGALIMAAEDRGPLMHARIGMLRALNRNVERIFGSLRKDTQWGKRKLKTDQNDDRVDLRRHQQRGWRRRPPQGLRDTRACRCGSRRTIPRALLLDMRS